jgi:hypothetical protein
MPHSCHPALEEQSSSAAQSWTSKVFHRLCFDPASRDVLFFHYLASAGKAIRGDQAVVEKGVVQIVQTSIRFFRSAFVSNAVATSLLRSNVDGGYPHQTNTFSLVQPVVALYVSCSCSAQPPHCCSKGNWNHHLLH